MKGEGIEQKFFCIGFCWGVWWAFRMSAKYDCFKAISGPHPSLGIEGALGGSDVKLAEQIQCPAYLLPAGNDPDNVKEKG
jgi:dienelactone hydrolase